MWGGTATNLEMTEGDYGIELPLVLRGVQINDADYVKFTLKKNRNGESVYVQTVQFSVDDPIDNPSSDEDWPWFRLIIPKATSDILTPGKYFYSLDWYDRNGTFLCNIIPNGVFKVVDKV